MSRVRLLEHVPARQRARTIEQADVVEAEKAALEQVVALGVLAVDPPAEIHQQLVEDALEKVPVAFAVLHRLRHNKRAVALERRDLTIDVQHLALQERGAVTRYDALWHTVKYDLPSFGFSFSIGLRVFFECQRDCFVSSFGNLE